MAEALFHTTCPSCGAPVHTHSATAVTVVCEYCNSQLVLENGNLHDTGRDSSIIQDFSPLKIGTTGQFSAQSFQIIGRLHVKYDDGAWNEWFIKFADQSTGWLSEAGDLYVLVQSIPTPDNLPQFNEICAGHTTFSFGQTFIASDVRNITLSNAAAQGELPFRLPEIYKNRVADWRCENAFLTLDYGSEPPEAFLGRTVSINELALQNTRSDAEITQSAGSLKNSRHSENCPNCGASIHWIAGQTPNVICASCGSELDTSGAKAQIITANNMRLAQEQDLALPLGKSGKVQGAFYTVIGAVRYEELSADNATAAQNGYPSEGIVPIDWWYEYLLYSPSAGFLWLVQTSNEWRVSRTQNAFPKLDKNGMPQNARHLFDYGGRVSFAVGAFYWHIRAGDVNLYRDFSLNSGQLSAEISRYELAWSFSKKIAYSELQTAFQLPPKKTDTPISPQLTYLMIAIYVIVNVPAWFMMSSDNWIVSAMISYFIIHFLYKQGAD